MAVAISSCTANTPGWPLSALISTSAFCGSLSFTRNDSGKVSGVRLFAYRARKKELSCEELVHARREADGAAKTLRGPEGKSLSPAQISRATMFAAEVSKELSAEMRTRRCKA